MICALPRRGYNAAQRGRLGLPFDDGKMLGLCNCLYCEAQYRFYYLKKVKLSTFDPHAWNVADTASLPVLSAPHNRSFPIRITFSVPMDPTAPWMDTVILADGNANVLDAYLLWSEDGKTLTVQPMECMEDMGNVAVYIRNGAPAAGGGILAKGTPTGSISRRENRRGSSR